MAVGVEGKAGLGEEAVDEFGPVLDAFEQRLDRGGELVDADCGLPWKFRTNV
jgi:hypothetical protein